jgi:protein-disulfide isomerase
LLTLSLLLALTGCHEIDPGETPGQPSGNPLSVELIGETNVPPGDPLTQLAQSLEALQSRLERLEQAGYQAAGFPSAQSLPPSLAGRVIDVSHLPAMGAADAELAIVEVTDYQCPYCKGHYQETLADLKAQYVESGRVRYFVLDYPLPGHELGVQAALATACAAKRELFWPFHDRLFELDSFQDQGEIIAIADQLGIPLEEFRACLNDWQTLEQLARQRSQAVGLGVQGTPTFFVGRLDRNRQVSTVIMLAGRRTLAEFGEVIDRYAND